MTSHTVSNLNAALEWDVAASPIPGEKTLGDRAVVAFAGGHALAAVVDGLGHGREAAAAAQAAASVLERSAGQDVRTTALECHRALRETRGAVLSLAAIDLTNHTMTWLGVGNVEGRLLHAAEPTLVTESLLLRSGIVGHHLPGLSAQTTNITRGDVLIFATDGIRRDFADFFLPAGSCRDIAERLLHEYALGSDDALVLVVRYLTRP